MTMTPSGRVRVTRRSGRGAYDDRRAKLQVDFRDGTRYVYSGVSPELFRDLLCAASKGSSSTDTFEAVSLVPN